MLLELIKRAVLREGVSFPIREYLLVYNYKLVH